MTEKRSEGFIPPHGGYAGLVAYQKALIVFRGTCRFCERFLAKRDRTGDQMVQAARSGKQNIVEASKISGTSKEAEIKLLNARDWRPEPGKKDGPKRFVSSVPFVS